MPQISERLAPDTRALLTAKAWPGPLARSLRRTFLHCVGGASRTPTIAAAYLVRHLGLRVDKAPEAVAKVTPYNPHNASFREVLSAMTEVTPSGLDPGPAEPPDRHLLGLGRPRPGESREDFASRFTLEIEGVLKRSDDQDPRPPEDSSDDEHPLSPMDGPKE